MVDLKTKNQGFKKLAGQLKQVRDVGLPATYTKICTQVGKDSIRDIKEVIIGRTAPLKPIGGYGEWEPLKAVTIMLKRKRGGGRGGNPATILYDSGQMYQSVGYRMVGPKTVAIGSDVPHAHDMEFGNPMKNTPARPFLGPGLYLATVNMKFYMLKVLNDTLQGRKVR